MFDITNPLVLTNNLDTDIEVQGITIPAGESYLIPYANIMAFAQDSILRGHIYWGDINLSVYGLAFPPGQASASEQVLVDILKGTLVFASY